MRLSKKIVGLLLVVAFVSVGTAYAAIDVSGLNTFNAVWDSIAESNSKITLLEAKIMELQAKNVELEAKVAELEGSGDQVTFALSTADYDSGWRTISEGSMKKIRHRLGTKNLLVYIIGKEWEESGQFWYVHQKHYGGYWYWNNPPTSDSEVHSHPLMEYYFVGLWWWTDSRNYIWVERGADDYNHWERFRVYIWILS